MVKIRQIKNNKPLSLQAIILYHQKSQRHILNMGVGEPEALTGLVTETAENM